MKRTARTFIAFAALAGLGRPGRGRRRGRAEGLEPRPRLEILQDGGHRQDPEVRRSGEARRAHRGQRLRPDHGRGLRRQGRPARSPEDRLRPRRSQGQEGRGRGHAGHHRRRATPSRPTSTGPSGRTRRKARERGIHCIAIPATGSTTASRSRSRPETNLVLNTVLDGDIEVRGVEGTFDVRNVNGQVRLIDAAGSGDAETVNGGVTVVFRRHPDGPCSFKIGQRRRRGGLPGRALGRLPVQDDARRGLFRLRRHAPAEGRPGPGGARRRRTASTSTGARASPASAPARAARRSSSKRSPATS